jgi:hypothetical protein
LIFSVVAKISTRIHSAGKGSESKRAFPFDQFHSVAPHSSHFVSQLELVRKQIQDARDAKEKARLEELERQRQLELERLRKQQAAEQAAQLKRQQELEEEQRKHQQAQQNLRGRCPMGFEWYKVWSQGSVSRDSADVRCRSVEAGGAAQEAISSQIDQSMVVAGLIILTFLSLLRGHPKAHAVNVSNFRLFLRRCKRLLQAQCSLSPGRRGR